MKKIAAAITAVLMAAFPAGAQFVNPLLSLEDSETVSALKEHVSMLSSAQMEGRAPGSEGEKMAADYLEQKLKEYGVDVLQAQTFGISEGQDTLTSRNVVGFLQGWDKSLNDRYIVIGARMDNLGADTYMVDGEPASRIYYGANGNASGMAMMLELAAKLSYARNLIRRSVLFVGFGSSTKTLAGSWYFLNRAFRDVDNIDAMINLDMVGLGENGFYAFTSSNEDLNSIVKTLQGELLPVQAQLTSAEPYTGDHRAFYDREIPSVLFTTGRYSEHGTGRDRADILDYEGMERELEYVYSYAQRLCNGQKPLFRNSSAREEVPVGVYAFGDVDFKPMFLNSPDPSTFMEKWVYQYLRYPKYAADNGIQGRVLVSFVIDEKGNVTDVKVTRGIHTSLDDEAVRVVSASPRWKPGRMAGKKVKVLMTAAVDFRLEKTKGKFGINGKTL
ncbi:MAG: TonB family protein [Bacteroidales bacterium]|nr:TonB family protein [Bacteroidales bacterium]